MKWIRFLLGLCQHEWVTDSVTQLLDHDTRLRYGTCYYLRCTKCGDIKRRKFG